MTYVPISTAVKLLMDRLVMGFELSIPQFRLCDFM